MREGGAKMLNIRWTTGGNKNEIGVSPSTLRRLQIDSREVTLHMGQWSRRMSIRVRESLGDNAMEIPQTFAQGYTIPANLPYEISGSGDDLFIGPLIAVVVRGGPISPGRMRRWNIYCSRYPHVGGLLYFCNAEDIDAERNAVRGIAYHSRAARTAAGWRPGIFPLPDAMYRLGRMKKKQVRQLQEVLQGKFFNARRFTKWEMRETLANAGYRAIPRTELLTGLPVLQQMLDQYGSVYLKPSDGLFGNRIYKIVSASNGFQLKDNKGKTKAEGTLADVFQTFSESRKAGDYLVQQDVSRRVDNKLVDFRVIVQKNGNGDWTCEGVIARLGIKEGIITNTVSDLCFGGEALRSLFGFSDREASQMERRIADMCKEAAAHMERAYGTYGDLGMDVAIDPDKRPWLLEINLFHQHSLAKDLEGGEALYRRITSNPLMFAKYLSGFGRR